MAAIPSFKIGHRDIDHVAICPGGIVAVETKWTALAPDASVLQNWADNAAATARSFRLELTNGPHRAELPTSLFHVILVIWQVRERTVSLQSIDTPLGTVTIMHGNDVAEWLSHLGTGGIAQDYAERLRQQLDATARKRDRIMPASRLVRHLARAR